MLYLCHLTESWKIFYEKAYPTSSNKNPLKPIDLTVDEKLIQHLLCNNVEPAISLLENNFSYEKAVYVIKFQRCDIVRELMVMHQMKCDTQYKDRLLYSLIIENCSSKTIKKFAKTDTLYTSNQIIFDDRFNSKIQSGYFPSSLTHLTFGRSFNQSVDSLPPRLTHLIFGEEFNKSVNNFSSSLTYLTFGMEF